MSKLIRKSTISLGHANQGKIDKLSSTVEEYTRVTNLYIQEIWNTDNFYRGKFSAIGSLDIDTWISARLQQACAKQALQIVLSKVNRERNILKKRLIKKRLKQLKSKKLSNRGFKKRVLDWVSSKLEPILTKDLWDMNCPVMERHSVELDSRFTTISFKKNSFDIWVRFQSLGKKIILNIPSKRHKHLNKFLGKEYWTLKQSTRLRMVDDQLLLDIFFERKKPEPRTKGIKLSIDLGIKKLGVTNLGQRIGVDLESLIGKINRKVQKSKAYYRAIIEKNEYINRCIKELPLRECKYVVLEQLSRIKKNTKKEKRLGFTMRKKIAYWTYRKFSSRLNLVCERNGIQIHYVNPRYTSRRCPSCTYCHRANRKREEFKCVDCGYENDSDEVGALNILSRFVSQESGSSWNCNMVPVSS